MTLTVRISAARISAAMLAAMLPLAAGLMTAAAADPTYAPGSRIGLVVPAGLEPARSFAGLEDAGKGVKVVAVEVPDTAYDAIEAALTQKEPPAGSPRPERFQTDQGPAYLTREKAQSGGESVDQFAMIARIDSAAGKTAALVTIQVPERAAQDYSSDVVRRMLASVALRAEVPVKEQLALLPFDVNDLGGFKTVRTLAPGQTVLLSDGDAKTALENTTSILVTVSRGGPSPQDDRGRFARQLIESVPGLKSGRLTSSEPQRIGGQQGYETRMEAVTNRDEPIVMVQWLRFGSGGFIRILGSAPKDEWEKVFPRLRAVRDGIEPK